MFCSRRRVRVGTLAAATSAAALTAGFAVAAPATGAPSGPSGPSRVAAAGATAPAAPARGQLTVAPSATIASTSGQVTARGKVTSATTRTVQLQQLIGRSSWRPVTSTRTVRGSYSLRLPTATPGKQRFRVVAVKAGAQPQLVSSAFDVSVGRGNPTSVAYLTNPPSRWNPCSSITYRVNLAGAPAGAARDVDAAVAQVAAATGLRFVKAGATTVVPGSAGRDVLDAYPAGTDLVIAYAKPGQSKYLAKASDVLAMGGAFYRPQVSNAGGRTWHEIIQGYVVLDRTQKLPGGFGTGNRYGMLGTWGQVLMHELGHVVGLDHPRGPSASQIMSANTTTKPAVWGAGDLVGLHRLGAASGCFGSAPKSAGAGITATTHVHHARAAH